MPPLVESAIEPRIRPDHESLAVVEHNRGEIALLGFTTAGPRHVPCENVDFTGLNRRATLSSRYRANLYCVGISKNCCCCLAEVNVETGACTGVIKVSKSGKVGAACASKSSLVLDLLKPVSSRNDLGCFFARFLRRSST